MAQWLGSENAGPMIDGFGFRLLRELVACGEPANAFISPYSISLALWMAANGAAGQTRHSPLGWSHLRPGRRSLTCGRRHHEKDG